MIDVLVDALGMLDQREQYRPDVVVLLQPTSPFRDALRQDGWKWLLYEVTALVIVGLLSMGLDRWRRYRRESSRTAAPSESPTEPGRPG